MPPKDVSNLYETPFLPTQIREVFGAHIANQRAIDAFLGMMEGEPALLLDALRLPVAVVVAAPKCRAAEVLESMPLNFANRLWDVAAAPERDADLKTYLHLRRRRGHLGLLRRDEADASDGAPVLF